jgi:hypothetical protein
MANKCLFNQQTIQVKEGSDTFLFICAPAFIEVKVNSAIIDIADIVSFVLGLQGQAAKRHYNQDGN